MPFYQEVKFERDVFHCLERIELYGDPLDIRFIEKKIGEYRLNAIRNTGLIKHLIHSHANLLEKTLNKVIENRRNGNHNNK